MAENVIQEGNAAPETAPAAPSVEPAAPATPAAAPATGAEQQPGLDELDREFGEGVLPPPIKREITLERNRRRDADARADRAERERAQALEALTTRMQQPEPVAVAPKPAQPPTRDQYAGDEEAFQNALIDYRTDLRIEARDRMAAEARARQEHEQAIVRFNDRTAMARSAHEDFDRVLSRPPVAFTPVVSNAIFDSDIGPEVVYYLCKPENHELAKKINAMPPVSAVREIGRLEEKLVKAIPQLAATAVPAPAATAPNAAKQPPPPIPAARSTSTATKPLAQMNYQEFVATRNAQLGRR